MTNQQKQEIQAAYNQYAEANNLSISDMEALTKVNKSYLSYIQRGQFVVITKPGQPGTEIADSHFKKIANAVGYKLTKQYWDVVPTRQFRQIIAFLEDSMKESKSGAIIGSTGAGKSYGVDRFISRHPLNTVRVTVSNIHSITDILSEITSKLRISDSGSKASRMNRIIGELQRRKMNGDNVLIIIDEAENIKSRAVFGLFKALYDGLKGICGVVLIGTQELVTKMEVLKKKDKDGMPQFYRRFKAGIRHLDPVDNTYQEFLNKYVPDDKGLRRLLQALCENYGELNDYLEPALREADRLEQPLTEDLFRVMYNMPKQ